MATTPPQDPPDLEVIEGGGLDKSAAPSLPGSKFRGRGFKWQVHSRVDHTKTDGDGTTSVTSETDWKSAIKLSIEGIQWSDAATHIDKFTLVLGDDPEPKTKDPSYNKLPVWPMVMMFLAVIVGPLITIGALFLGVAAALTEPGTLATVSFATAGLCTGASVLTIAALLIVKKWKRRARNNAQK